MSSQEIKEAFTSSIDKIDCIINPLHAIESALKECSQKDEIYIIGSHFFAPFIGKLFKNCFAIHKKTALSY